MSVFSDVFEQKDAYLQVFLVGGGVLGKIPAKMQALKESLDIRLQLSVITGAHHIYRCISVHTMAHHLLQIHTYHG